MIPIKSVMTKNVISVQESTPIYEAMALLKKHGISGLPVVDENNYLKGILSEKDVLGILLNGNIGTKDTVGHYMSRDIVSFTEQAGAREVCQFFIKHHIRRVPIVKDGQLIGIVSRHDLISLILEAKSKLSMQGYS